MKRDLFFQGYLFSIIFWLGISLGSQMILMMHSLTGGAWGEKIKPLLVDSSKGVFVMGLLFIPFLIWGVPILYPWEKAEAFSNQSLQSFYLSSSFFNLRAISYFLIWIFIGFAFSRAKNKERWAAGGLILYFLTISFASIDWIMSLEPNWYSTISGLVIIIGMGLSALCYTVIRIKSSKEKRLGIDLGNLLLTFVMVWAYFAFSQYLIVWMGNLPDESRWYVFRTHQGWGTIAVLLIIFQFLVPFVLLLFKALKASKQALTILAFIILIMNGISLFWTVLPGIRQQFHIGIFDLAAFITVGFFWLSHQRRQRQTI